VRLAPHKNLRDNFELSYLIPNYLTKKPTYMKPIFQRVSVLLIILFGPIGFANIAYSNITKPISLADKTNTVSINEADEFLYSNCLPGSDSGYENAGSGYSFYAGSFVTTNQQHVYEGVYSIGIPAAGASVTSPKFSVTAETDFELFYTYKSQHNTIDYDDLIEVTFTWYDNANIEISKSLSSHTKRSFGRWKKQTLLTTSPTNAASVSISYINATDNIVYFDSGCFAESVDREISISSDISTDEGSNLAFTISINKPFYDYTNINIAYTGVTATENEDYTPSKFFIDIPPYINAVRFIVSTTDDNIFEANETLNVIITSDTPDVAIGNDTAIGTILDNEASVGPSSINFDGVDDYAATDSELISGLTDMTMMGWIKVDPSFTGGVQSVMMGQDNLEINVNNYGTPNVELRFGGVPINSAQFDGATPLIKLGEWVHIAAVYNGSASTSILYVNGVERSKNTAVSGSLNINTHPFTIGRRANTNSHHFKGNIDEVRVFKTNLTEDQVRGMVYQEITQLGTNVGGTIVPKPIKDTNSDASVSWTSLIAYYPMTDILNGKINDISGNGRNAFLHNISTINPQTAPMPYETIANGAWTEEATWLYGSVWDIEDIANNREWSIVKIKNNVSTVNSHTNLGLIIDSNSSLKVNGDQAITNTRYLQLDGVLDLQNDSQLIQTDNSDLVTSNQGRILRRQEGNTNVYWYNYFTSPVGALNATSLSDNNMSGTGNINNTPFALNLLKQEDGNSVNFSTALNPPLTNPVTISSRWLYNFQNGITYNDWVAMDENSAIIPGMGYTQKGTGSASTEQQYIFEGKPNNGTILIAANDVDGDSANESEEDLTLTTTLIGNPYPSALDARKFIADNAGVIEGTILLWEQWAGSSHNLAEYEGGYGYINSMTTLKPYQHSDISIPNQTQTESDKTPTFYIPVAQGFFVEVVEDGNIEFNNSQRIFKKEADGESVFFDPESIDSDKPNNVDSNKTADNPNDMELIRFEFSTSEGASRQFVTGFSDSTTDNYDYGYDGGRITTVPNEDMGVYVNDKQYVLQAFAPITEDKVINLTFNGSGTMTYSLKIIDIQNIDETQGIFLRDNKENILWDLRQEVYNFSATPGQDHDRFDIVFENRSTLDVNEFNITDILIYVNANQDKLFVKGLNQDAQSLSFTNILGQTIKTFRTLSVNTIENGIDVSNLASGVYIVNLTTQNNKVVTKKIILE